MNNYHNANILVAVSCSVLGAIGCLGNSVLVVILSRNFRQSQPYEKIIFATLLTDLCLCIVFGCLQPLGGLNGSSVICKAAGFLTGLLINMSQVWIAINMFSRYLAIYYQEKYRKWFNTRRIVIYGMSSVIGNLPGLMTLVYYDAFGPNGMGGCGVNPLNRATKMCVIFSQAFTVVSNVACIIFGYAVMKKLKGHIVVSSSTLDTRLLEESRQIVILVGISAAIPILVQGPLVVVWVAQHFTTLNPWISRAAVSFFALVPSAGPFVTAVIIKPYRQKCLKLVPKCARATTTTTNVVRMNILDR